MKNIDIYNWKRGKHYDYFKSFDNPSFSVNVNIDITLLIDKIKARNLKFFPSVLFVIMKGMNEVEELKYRINEENVLLYDVIHPSYTVLNNDENFVFCHTEYRVDFMSFYKQVLTDIEKAKSGDNLEDEAMDNLVFVSSVPWVSFNSVSHPFSKNENLSIPRVTFGKYFENNDKVLLPFSIQVHHGLCDGLHIGKLLNNIESSIMMF